MAESVDIWPCVAAVARPGDTVLIGFSRSLTDEDIEALDDSFKPLTEQGIKIGYMDQSPRWWSSGGSRMPRSRSDYALLWANGMSFGEVYDLIRQDVADEVLSGEPEDDLPIPYVVVEGVPDERLL